MAPLNPNDKVRIKSLNMPGTVLGVRPGAMREPEEEKYYEVQIVRYFRRTDLDPHDPEAEEAQREKSLQEKTARLEAARNKVEQSRDAGGNVSAEAAIELLQAADEVWKELDHESILKPIRG